MSGGERGRGFEGVSGGRGRRDGRVRMLEALRTVVSDSLLSDRIDVTS